MLYPPYIEGTLPAFYLTYDSSGTVITGAKITIPFTMNNTVSSIEFQGFALRIKTVQTGVYIFAPVYSTNYSLTDNTVIFSLDAAKAKLLNEGQFYKAQIAYCETINTNETTGIISGDDIGYYSTVGVIKCTSKPSITIDGLTIDSVNMFSNSYIGIYSQEGNKDLTEKVYSYNFIVYDDDNNIYYQTDEILHDSSGDSETSTSTDEFILNDMSVGDKTYGIQYNVTTLNGLEVSSPIYKFTTENYIEAQGKDIIINAECDRDNGYITITFKGITDDIKSTAYRNKYSVDKILETYDITLEQLKNIYKANQNGIEKLNIYLTSIGNKVTNAQALAICESYEETYYFKYNNLTQDELIEICTLAEEDELNDTNTLKIFVTKLGKVSLKQAKAIYKEYTVEQKYYGEFLLTRSSDEDDYSTWCEINRFRVDDEEPSNISIIDITVEQGRKYKYALQQYNLWGLYSQRFATKIVECEFEDAFLYDGERLLKIKYNPKISSFKTDLLEAKQNTLGSKYPYIFRNGKVYYKEFPIAGLIAQEIDENELFINRNLKTFIRQETIARDDTIWPEFSKYPEVTFSSLPSDATETQKSQYAALMAEKMKVSNAKSINAETWSGEYKYNNQSRDPINRDTETEQYRNYHDYTDENIFLERQFKLAVLEWLNDGKPKLFKSPEEGNYIVRLMNTSLTPQETLGRMLHDFSTTAYEIADCTYENLVKFGFLNIEDPSDFVGLWKSIDLEHDYEAGEDINITFDSDLMSFVVQDMFPGDSFYIEYYDAPEQKVIIGTTGSYYFRAQGNTVTGLRIPAREQYPYEYNGKQMGTIHCYYKGTRITLFDQITDVKLKSIPASEYIGVNPLLLKVKERDWSSYASSYNNGVASSFPFPEDEYKKLQTTSFKTILNQYVKESRTSVEGSDTDIVSHYINYATSWQFLQAIKEYEPGDVMQFVNTTLYDGTVYKTKLLNLEQLHFRLRELIPVYIVKTENGDIYVDTTPFGTGYPLSELADNYSMIDPFAIFQVNEFDGEDWVSYNTGEILGATGCYDAYYKDWTTDYDTSISIGAKYFYNRIQTMLDEYGNPTYEDDSITYHSKVGTIGLSDYVANKYWFKSDENSEDFEWIQATAEGSDLIEGWQSSRIFYTLEEVKIRKIVPYYNAKGIYIESLNEKNMNEVYVKTSDGDYVSYADYLNTKSVYRPTLEESDDGSVCPVYYSEYYYYYDLKFEKEKVFHDLEDGITRINIGNGIMVETTFQILVNDFYTETTNQEVKEAKEKYLKDSNFLKNLMASYEILHQADLNKTEYGALEELYYLLINGNVDSLLSNDSKTEVQLLLDTPVNKESLKLLTLYDFYYYNTALSDKVVEAIKNYLDISDDKTSSENSCSDLIRNEDTNTFDNIHIYKVVENETSNGYSILISKKDIIEDLESQISEIETKLKSNKLTENEKKELETTKKSLEGKKEIYIELSIDNEEIFINTDLYSEKPQILNEDDLATEIESLNLLYYNEVEIEENTKSSLNEENQIISILNDDVFEGVDTKLQVLDDTIATLEQKVSDLEEAQEKEQTNYIQQYNKLMTSIESANNASLSRLAIIELIRLLMYGISDETNERKLILTPGDIKDYYSGNNITDLNQQLYQVLLGNYNTIYDLYNQCQYYLTEIGSYEKIIKDNSGDVELDDYLMEQMEENKELLVYDLYYIFIELSIMKVFYESIESTSIYKTPCVTYIDAAQAYHDGLIESIKSLKTLDFVQSFYDFWYEVYKDYEDEDALLKGYLSTKMTAKNDSDVRESINKILCYYKKLEFVYNMFTGNFNSVKDLIGNNYQFIKTGEGTAYDEIYKAFKNTEDKTAVTITSLFTSIPEDITENFTVLKNKIQVYNSALDYNGYYKASMDQWDQNNYYITEKETLKEAIEENCRYAIMHIDSSQESGESYFYTFYFNPMSNNIDPYAYNSKTYESNYLYYSSLNEEERTKISTWASTLRTKLKTYCQDIIDSVSSGVIEVTQDELNNNISTLRDKYVSYLITNYLSYTSLSTAANATKQFQDSSTVQVLNNYIFSPSEGETESTLNYKVLNDEGATTSQSTYYIELSNSSIDYQITKFNKTILEATNKLKSVLRGDKETLDNIEKYNNLLIEFYNDNEKIITNYYNILKISITNLNKLSDDEKKIAIVQAIADKMFQSYESLEDTGTYYDQDANTEEDFYWPINSKETSYEINLFNAILDGISDTDLKTTWKNKLTIFTDSNIGWNVDDTSIISCFGNGNLSNKYELMPYYLYEAQTNLATVCEGSSISETGLFAWYLKYYYEVQEKQYLILLKQAKVLKDVYEVQLDNYEDKYTQYKTINDTYTEVYDSYFGTEERNFYEYSTEEKLEEYRQTVRDDWEEFVQLLDEAYTAERERGLYQ